ncbi:MAG: GNAT family N-acetyltransferase, partial [Myxococcales bacterium]|nr:GNAT family N-acetyltransferase [Myxococcales bacterium]
MSTITGVEFRPLAIPATMQDDGADDFAAMVVVRNAIYREISGHGDHDVAADELLPHYQPDEDEIRLSWLILADGSPVGRIGLDLPVEGESRVAYMLVELLRRVHRRGIGSAAYALVEDIARSHGRTVIQSWAEHPDIAGPRLEAPTGFGSVPADEPATRFYLHHGFTLEQIERNSALNLHAPFDEIERLLEVARAASTDYRVVSWEAPTPPDFVEGYGWMKSRMVTDAPAAALEFDEEEWDAARVA